MTAIKIMPKQNTLGLMTKLPLESTFMIKGLFALNWAGDELPLHLSSFVPLFCLLRASMCGTEDIT